MRTKRVRCCEDRDRRDRADDMRCASTQRPSLEQAAHLHGKTLSHLAFVRLHSAQAKIASAERPVDERARLSDAGASWAAMCQRSGEHALEELDRANVARDQAR